MLLPGVVTAIYLFGFAADQYASKVGFSVRQEDSSSAIDLLGGLSSISGSSSPDTDILYEYIKTQKLVEEIDQLHDLREIWSKPSGDPIFAIDPDVPIEGLVDYWEDMVRISYGGSSSGLIEVEVRAFTAEDATMIAQTILDKSSEMINELSAIAREDGVSYAREELDTALERLKQARETVTRFRNENQLINPEMDLQMQAGLLANLQQQQAQTLIDLGFLEGTTQEGDPRLTQARRRLGVIEDRIQAEREKLGLRSASESTDAGTERAFADVVGEYERLTVDREFAEKAYITALASYDAALAEARRKSRYLAAYMQPTQAETPQYPQSGTLLSVIVMFLFLVWAIVVMVAYSIKDRR